MLMKTVVLALGILGQWASIRQHHFMSGNHFLYYTNLTNVLIILLMAVLMGFEWKAHRAEVPVLMPAWLQQLRFILTSAILLTLVGFSLLLIPLVDRDYLLSPSNLLVHNAVPLLACLDYVLFSQRDGRPRLWLSLLGPFAYGLFALALALSGHRFHGSVAPYFFLDYEKQGWFTLGAGKLGVIYWMLLMAALQLALAKVLSGLRAMVINKQKINKNNAA